MSEEHDAPTTAPAVEPEEQPDDSLMGRLRELRRESREDEHLTLEIPSFKGELGVRYKAIPRDELKKIYGKSGRSQDDDIDLLLRLCDCIVVRNGDERFEPLTDEHGDTLRFDARLASYLNIDIKTERKARECLEGVFSLDLYPLAASRHVKALVQWMEGVEVKADEGFLGE